MSISPMDVKSLSYIILSVLLSSCAVYKTDTIIKIALLAPFEGQYREIGYDALYAARLAISEQNLGNLDLLAIDDGGSTQTATLRMAAISQDLSIAAVIALGPYAATEDAQLALGNVPMLIVGHWNTRPVSESVFLMTNPELDSLVDFEADITDIANNASRHGSEILALQQVPLLLEDVSQLTIYSSGSPPDADFRERYLASAEFAPEPGLLATLTYDATQIVLQSIQTNTPIAEISYEGINGRFSFENGYWVNGPIHRYHYENVVIVNSE